MNDDDGYWYAQKIYVGSGSGWTDKPPGKRSAGFAPKPDIEIVRVYRPKKHAPPASRVEGKT